VTATATANKKNSVVIINQWQFHQQASQHKGSNAGWCVTQQAWQQQHYSAMAVG